MKISIFALSLFSFLLLSTPPSFSQQESVDLESNSEVEESLSSESNGNDLTEEEAQIDTNEEVLEEPQVGPNQGNVVAPSESSEVSDEAVDAAAAIEEGDLESAIDIANENIEDEPTSADSYAVRGLAQYGEGNLEAAISDIEKAVMLFRQQGQQEKADELQEILGALEAQ